MVFSPKGLQERRHRVQGLQTASPRGRGVRRGLRAEPHRGIHGEPSENYGKSPFLMGKLTISMEIHGKTMWNMVDITKQQVRK